MRNRFLPLACFFLAVSIDCAAQDGVSGSLEQPPSVEADQPQSAPLCTKDVDTFERSLALITNLEIYNSNTPKTGIGFLDDARCDEPIDQPLQRRPDFKPSAPDVCALKTIKGICNPFDAVMGGVDLMDLCRFVGGKYTPGFNGMIPDGVEGLQKKESCTCGSKEINPWRPEVCVDGVVKEGEDAKKRVEDLLKQIGEWIKTREGLAQALKLLPGCTLNKISCDLCGGFNCQDFTHCLCGCVKGYGGTCSQFNFICANTLPKLTGGLMMWGGLQGHRLSIIEVKDKEGKIQRCLVEPQTGEIIACFTPEELPDVSEWSENPPTNVWGAILYFYLNHPNQIVRDTFAYLKNCDIVGKGKQRPFVQIGVNEEPLKRCCYCRKDGAYGSVYPTVAGSGSPTNAQCQEACSNFYGAGFEFQGFESCGANSPSYPRSKR